MDLKELNKVYDFTKRTIMIPGGAGILGGEMACALIACGANVVIVDYEPERADRLKDRLECGPGRVEVLHGNVLDRESLVQVREKVQSEIL